MTVLKPLTTMVATVALAMGGLTVVPASAASVEPTDGLWQMTVTQTGANALYGVDGASVVEFSSGAVPKLTVSAGPSGFWELLKTDPTGDTYSGVAPSFGTACGVVLRWVGAPNPVPAYMCLPTAAQLSLTAVTEELLVGTATVLSEQIPGTFPIIFERVSSLRGTASAPRNFTHSPWNKQGKRYRTRVTWAPPADTGVGGEVTGYEVAILRDGVALFELTTKNPSVILRNLPRGRVYVARVKAVNSAGPGDPAEFVLPVPGALPPDGGSGAPGGEAPPGPVPQIISITPSTGRPGSFVRITGVNFDELAYVKFGNRLAAFYLESPTTIVATAPAGSGRVDIAVGSRSGVSTIKNGFTYSSSRWLRNNRKSRS
jgi:hypothetical protein